MPKLRLLLRGITLPMLRLLAGPFVQRNAPSVSWGVSFCLPRFKLTHYLGTESASTKGRPPTGATVSSMWWSRTRRPNRVQSASRPLSSEYRKPRKPSRSRGILVGPTGLEPVASSVSGKNAVLFATSVDADFS